MKRVFESICALCAFLSVCFYVAASNAVGNCNLSKSWCTQEPLAPGNLQMDTVEWGSFRPGTYFGMKAKGIGPVLGTGVMWSSSLTLGNSLRDQTAHDELTRFEWVRHDGKRFGTEILMDDSYGIMLEASFVVPEAVRNGRNSSTEQIPDWFQKLVLNEAPGNVSGDANEKKSFVFYFGTECVDGNTAACLSKAKSFGWKVNYHRGSAERGFDSAVSIVGHTETTGWFCLFLVVQQLDASGEQGAPSVSFTGLGGVNLLQGADRLKDEAKLAGISANEQPSAGTRRSRKHQQQLRSTLFDDFGDLNNELEDGTSFVAVHVGFGGRLRVDALLYSHLTVGSHDELAGFIGQAESERAANVLPFSMSTALTVSHRSLMRTSPPSVVSTPRSEAVVDSSGRVVEQPSSDASSSSSSSNARDVARTTSSAEDEPLAAGGKGGDSVTPTEDAGPLVPVHCANRGECIRAEVDQLLQKYAAAFDDHFAAVFPLERVAAAASMRGSEDVAAEGGGAEVVPVFTQNDVEAAKVCLSSLLGGMGYFQGHPQIGGAADVELESGERALSEAARANQLVKGVHAQAAPVSLFTATPSRTAFPRGFLWDEGFHQLLVSQWDPTLSMQVIASWLDAMHFPCTPATASDGDGDSRDSSAGTGGYANCVGGWIPREMILGEEARRRVPDEFVVQRVNIANPPTFLLVVDNLLTRFERAEPPRRSATTAASAASKLDQLPLATSGELSLSSEALREEEVHGDKEVMRRYRKALDPRDAQLVQVQHSANRDAVLRFLRDVYPQLHRWVQWFLHSQRGSSAYPGSFRWRGRSAADGKVIPNTLASGLDDYPRSPLPSAEEHHVDLHCWMTKATAVMARLERVLRESGEEYALPPASQALSLMAQYQSQHEYLLQRLEELHWSHALQGFFDVGANDEEAVFSQELVFRCSNPQDQSTKDITVPLEVVRQRKQDFCPASHPKALFPLGDGQGNYKMVERLVMDNPQLAHIPRVGYVALFPLLLRLLDPFSPKLGAVLDMVEDPQLLWTEHGLRSIARTDKYYQRRNSPGDAPYWRGPIWIPINYLALGALHHYAAQEGVFQARAQRLYGSLRDNVLQTVLGQYASTGHFWEQYEDSTGAGMRGHPFTGWTALVVNIMAEKY